MKKDHFKDLNARSNQILKRPKNTHIIPTAKWKRSKLAPKHILRRPELIWNQKFVPTQQLWQSTRPNAAPSPPHPHYTADSPPGCGVGCYLLVVVVVGFFVLFFPFPHSHSSLPQLNPFFSPFSWAVFFAPAFAFLFYFCSKFPPPFFFYFLLYATSRTCARNCNKCACSTVCVKRSTKTASSSKSWEIQDTRRPIKVGLKLVKALHSMFLMAVNVLLVMSHVLLIITSLYY